MRIDLFAIGKDKSGPTKALFDEYNKRLGWKLTLHELPNSDKIQENKKLLASLPDQAILIALDEKGKNLGSEELANQISHWANIGQSHLAFIIGGADGLTDELKEKADLIISFGKATWPHMLVRVMLIEQIYRAQQILAGHPYHRS